MQIRHTGNFRLLTYKS